MDFRQALGERGRLVLADPAAVPAGRYAREALVALGAWPQVEARLVPTDNVRTALNFVARGEAPLGIVYATDARAEPRVRIVDGFPPHTHQPVVYPAAALSGAGPQGRRFVEFLAGPVARAIFLDAGFSDPPSAEVRGGR
jgi:molybdate transport system substrate-binding protein